MEIQVFNLFDAWELRVVTRNTCSVVHTV